MTLLWQDARRKAQETLDNYWDHSYPVKIVSICKAMGVTPLNVQRCSPPRSSFRWLLVT